MCADVLFAELASDFGGELVVGGGPFREPPTVMQSTVAQNANPPDKRMKLPTEIMGLAAL